MQKRQIALIAQYQRLADDLLADYTMTTGHLPEAPAEVLPGLVRLQGWSLKFTPLLPNRLAECDRAARVIRVADDLADRLEYPERAREVAHSTIAHELGHAVLHSAPRRSRTIPKGWEWEARVFSAVLLCPWSRLAGRPEIVALSGNLLTMKERWARVHDLAADFRVTPSFAVSALCLHGVLERCGTGLQAPSSTLATLAAPLRA